MPFNAEDSRDSVLGQLLGSARSLWQLRVFRRFCVANLVSKLGTSAFVMPLSWLTVKNYGASGIAALALGYGIPFFLVALMLWIASTHGTDQRDGAAAPMDGSPAALQRFIQYHQHICSGAGRSFVEHWHQ